MELININGNYDYVLPVIRASFAEKYEPFEIRRLSNKQYSMSDYLIVYIKNFDYYFDPFNMIIFFKLKPNESCVYINRIIKRNNIINKFN
jgi:hypothetical protein